MITQDEITKMRIVADVQITNFRKNIKAIVSTAEKQHEELMKSLTLLEEMLNDEN